MALTEAQKEEWLPLLASGKALAGFGLTSGRGRIALDERTWLARRGVRFTHPALEVEFGGGPGDYQLMEEEDETGQTRLTLVVHPQIEALDETNILARLRAELSQRSRGDRFMTDVWAKSGTFKLKREVPYASPRGKILPLHITRDEARSPEWFQSITREAQ